MDDNKHLVELSECDDLRSKLRKSITTLMFWVVGGLACASMSMFGILYNKMDSFTKDYITAQYVIQQHIGSVTSDINNIKNQLDRLINLNNHNKQSKNTIVYGESNICDSKGDG